MPLRGIDFSRSNQAISRFNQFLQYDLLDQFRSDRDVAILSVSDRLQRERQAEEGERQKDIAEFKSNLTDKEAYTKAMLDIGKLPQYDYLVSMARLATDPNLPPQFHDQARGAAKEYAALIGPLAAAAYNASRGLTTWEDYQSLLYGGGFKGMEEGMKETGTNIRARITANTAAGEQAVGRERIAAEGAGRAQAQTDKATERYIKWIDDTTQFLVGEGVQGEAIVGAGMPIYLESKSRDPLSSEDRGKALTYLQQLRAKVMKEGPDSLTDGNVSFITKVWNTPGVQGYVSERLKKVEGGVGGPPVAGNGRGAAAPAAPARRGGVPNPDTGMSEGDEEASVMQQRTDQVQQYASQWLQTMYPGADPKTYTQDDWAKAKARAEAWVRVLRGESTMEEELARSEQEAAVGSVIKK